MSKKVLVIGDELLSGLVVATIRRRVDITIDTCLNGRKALSVAKHIKPRLILLCGTESIPRLNGLVILREILRRGCFRKTKVLLLTASERIGRKAVLLGCSGYLLKPFDVKELEEFLNRVINDAPSTPGHVQ